ncbi:phosphopentomutase [Paenibacillus sp. ACRRX]|uniref:phosphopentomutase n=1 Tax=Paenibacillus sp. ACRRX TaxID=2918206 RepID=UPI001EF722D9|nr:phosphopentomutase [Paenibacillus sp. ACRRX]MCG7406966.1 phosphopentomutase [Paenibacillus sp. ACRRX]
MGKFIVVIIDSFGIGAMDDVAVVRQADIKANTCKHILEYHLAKRLPNLERLGLMNALGEEVGSMRFAVEALVGTSDLMHEGADSFLGHQEIMGSRPLKPLIAPFSTVLDHVQSHLEHSGYVVERIGESPAILLVNGTAVVGDNLETDSGQVYNVTGLLDQMTFEQIEELGRCVRDAVFVSRVIAFGGEHVSIEQLLAARQVKEGVYAGIDTPLSGVYKSGYRVVHLGYGVNSAVQIPTILGEAGIPVSLIGKVENIVSNAAGRNRPGVDTADLLEITLHEMHLMSHGFICVNIQETDLAGHAQDTERYMNRLEVCDRYVGHIMELMADGDILIITADHGNDPTIGHSRHTREKVPILVYQRQGKSGHIGHYSTLSCIGATVADYFHVKAPENGTSFLSSIV